MRAAKHDLYIEQGTTFQPLEIELFDDSGAALDLTGATAVAHIKNSHSETTPTASFSVAFAEPRTLGKLTLTMTPTETAALPMVRSKGAQAPATRFVYDLKLTRGDGVVIRLIEGTITVSPEVSR